MTEILQDIAGVAVALGGFELIKWSANLIINRRNEKRKAESEADKQEVEVDAAQFHLYKERLEELRQANKEVNDQNLELIKAAARKVDEIAVPPYTRAEYEAKVSELIRRRYTLDAELAILRQRESKPQEYACYNAFAEKCKAEAKELLSQPRPEADEPTQEGGEDEIL